MRPELAKGTLLASSRGDQYFEQKQKILYGFLDAQFISEGPRIGRSYR